MSPILVPADPRVIVTHTYTDGRVTLAMARWPRVAVIADAFLSAGDPRVVLRYPFLVLRLANAHAVYRVESCEVGLWEGALVEGWVDRPEDG